MGKYDPLSRFLENRKEDEWQATFNDVERVLGFQLPPSAHDYPAWWANEKGGGHSQKRGWQDAGWETSKVDLQTKRVRFCRAERNGARHTNDDMWSRAHRLTGIEDREKLVEAAIKTLLQVETARQLAELGGSDPNASVAPRRRFW